MKRYAVIVTSVRLEPPVAGDDPGVVRSYDNMRIEAATLWKARQLFNAIKEDQEDGSGRRRMTKQEHAMGKLIEAVSQIDAGWLESWPGIQRALYNARMALKHLNGPAWHFTFHTGDLSGCPLWHPPFEGLPKTWRRRRDG